MSVNISTDFSFIASPIDRSRSAPGFLNGANSSHPIRVREQQLGRPCAMLRNPRLQCINLDLARRDFVGDAT
jgi:hypothetical protein